MKGAKGVGSDASWSSISQAQVPSFCKVWQSAHPTVVLQHLLTPTDHHRRLRDKRKSRNGQLSTPQVTDGSPYNSLWNIAFLKAVCIFFPPGLQEH